MKDNNKISSMINSLTIGGVASALFGIISYTYNINFVKDFAWVLILLGVGLICYKLYRVYSWKISVIVLILGVIGTFLLVQYNEPGETVSYAYGSVSIEKEVIIYGTELEDTDNKPKKLEVEYAKLTNLDSGFVYKKFEDSNSNITFIDVKPGDYKVEIKLKGYKLYEDDNVNYKIDTLAQGNKTKSNPKKILKFVKYINPEWDRWGNWSEWQAEPVSKTSKVDVEIKRSQPLSYKTVGTIYSTYKDVNKPLYGKRQVKVGTKDVKDENGNITKQDVWGTVNVIVDYETSKSVNKVYDISEEGNVMYRYRKRFLKKGKEEIIYAYEDCRSILEEEGYEVEDYLDNIYHENK